MESSLVTGCRRAEGILSLDLAAIEASINIVRVVSRPRVTRLSSRLLWVKVDVCICFEKENYLLIILARSPGVGDDPGAMLEWEDADRFSFEDSDRFEEDSLCSWSSEPESLCNNWRGWKRPTLGSGTFGTSKRSVEVYSHLLGEGVENHFGEKNTLSTPNRDSNLNLPIIGNIVYCESSALDHAATGVDFIY
uniref:Uncharacterized protein n=1 Tax=Timema cristinae TaxID=61476 RepID=A0A7R9CXA7_TIMCR|nr:unnamed protein product [Timema cristinae]